MAIGIDAVSTPTVGNTTWSHTVGAGSDRLLVVVTGTHSTELPTGVTYGGVAMSLYVEKSGNYRDTRIYYLTNPTSGAANVVVSGSFSSYGCVCGAISFTGVNQDNPFRGSASQFGSSSSPSLNISSATNDLVLDMITYYAGTTPVLTEGAGQTSRLGYSCGSSKIVAECSTEAGAASVDMSWTATGMGDNNYSQCAVSIQPVDLDITLGENLTINDGMKADAQVIVSEALTIDDVIHGGFSLPDSLSEGFTIDDATSVIRQVPITVAENLSINDAFGLDLRTAVSEGMSFNDIFEAAFRKPFYRYKIPIKATGKHISLMFRNNVAGQNLFLEDVKLKLEKNMGMTRSKATQIKATGGHLSLKFQNNEVGKKLYLLYVGCEIGGYIAR